MVQFVHVIAEFGSMIMACSWLAYGPVIADIHCNAWPKFCSWLGEVILTYTCWCFGLCRFELAAWNTWKLFERNELGLYINENCNFGILVRFRFRVASHVVHN